ncbi:MAG: MarR family transcriptional regulator [Bacilli bacterium]
MDKYLEILRLMSHVNHRFKNTMRKRTLELGIKDSFRPFMYHICRNEGLSQTELVCLLGFKAPTVSLTLDQLESHGYILRKVDDKDQRMIRIYPTSKMLKTDEMLTKLAIKTSEEFLKDLTEEELEVSKSILIKIKGDTL